MNGMNLRDPGQAGLLFLGAVLLIVTPLCVSMAALHAGMTWTAVAVPVAVIAAGAVVLRIARAAAPARPTDAADAGVDP